LVSEQVSAGRQFEQAVAFVESVRLAEAIAYVEAVQVAVAYVAAVQAQEAEQARQEALRASQTVSQRVPAPSAPSGSYTALAVCEQGRNGQPYNAPFYGYFSIMDGSAAGKSWDQQVAMVQAIKARAGAGAWDGCAKYVP
jgi:hypothetical protein